MKQIQIVELCCGLGGWSRGFYEIAPHNVVCHGIDVMDYGYPFRFIEADLFDWEPPSNLKVDVVVASPPCRDFSKALFFAYGTQKEHEGLDLVQRIQYLVRKMNPKYWLIENVPHLADFIGPPKEIVYYGKTSNHKQAYLWGNFPSIPMFDQDFDFKTDNFGNSDIRRAEIPLPFSKAVAKGILHELLPKII